MTMDPKRLWAKSKRLDQNPHPSMLLLQHLKDVHASADKLLDATASDQLTALGLDPKANSERLRRCVVLAAKLHDIGKANDHFQGMLLRAPERQDKQQGIRHEWVTILMMKLIRDAVLGQIDERDLVIVEWAVAGHHPAHNHDSPPKSSPGGSGAEITLRLSAPDFQEILGWLEVKLDTPQSLKRSLVGSESVFNELKKWSIVAAKHWDALHADDRKLVAAVKSSLIAADIAGSSLPKVKAGESWDWISKSFQAKPTPDELNEIVLHRLRGEKPRPFQSEVAASESKVTFVKAGCGTGKTLAAYMWVRDRCPGRRLYFCYPTTGTATEGFKDYLFPPESEDGDDKSDLSQKVREIGARLFHSRRDVDYEIILSTGPDSQFTEAELAARLDSLEAWATPIVACTVDTVLGLVQNNRRGLFAWPALAGAGFVFDEIHAYDDRLFGALLRFLRDLPGLPVLLMTASLPAPREEALRSVLEDRGIVLKPISGPKELEELPRYHKLPTETDPLEEVAKTCDANGKVLWVCNTVARVMDAADRAAARGLNPLIYHSRFKYTDRVNRHKDVIDAFKGTGPALAVCSQVAEMSLDLSADLLVTDLAPVPSLIQRLGRLNRKASDGKKTKPFLVVEPDNHLPYTPNDRDMAKAWLAKLPVCDISQKQLAEAWEQSAENPPDLVASAWLDGGPITTVTELREASPGISVLMQSDLHKVQSAPKLTGRFVLPMPPPPRAFDWKNWPRERGLPVAPTGTIDYDELRGAKWTT